MFDPDILILNFQYLLILDGDFCAIFKDINFLTAFLPMISRSSHNALEFFSALASILSQ
jgi:hypothetical protein